MKSYREYSLTVMESVVMTNGKIVGKCPNRRKLKQYAPKLFIGLRGGLKLNFI